MRITTLADKKLSKMTASELVDEAQKGPAEAEMVLSYVRAIAKWPAAGQVIEALSAGKKMCQNPQVVRKIVETIPELMDRKAAMRSLSNVMTNGKGYIQEKEMVTMASSLPWTAPVFMLIKVTPQGAILDIAGRNGFVKNAPYEQQKMRISLATEMAKLTGEGWKWENAVSGMLFSSLLKENRGDKAVAVLVEGGSSFPATFVRGVSQMGGEAMSEKIMAKVAGSEDADTIEWFIMTLEDADRAMQLTDSLLNNPSVPIKKKLSFIRESLPAIESSNKQIISSHVFEDILPESTVPELYEIALESLESGGYEDVGKLTANVIMAAQFAERLWEAAKDRGLQDKVSPGFLQILSLMGGGPKSEDDWSSSG